MIRGIGPVYAKKMVKAFGEKVFDIIEAEPDRLREVTGIGAVRAKHHGRLGRAEDRPGDHGLPAQQWGRNRPGCSHLQDLWRGRRAGDDREPLSLARDIRGIGFKTADAIAMKLGIEKTAMIRLRAGISYALTEAMDEGHCGLPTDQLIPLAEELLEAPKELILPPWSWNDPTAP